MKAVYLIRVMVLSFEALLIIVALFVWNRFHARLEEVARGLELNEDLLKYLLLLPLALVAWVANEVRQLLFEDKDTTRALTAWPDYWKLKVHVWVALIYALLFAVMSVAPWVVKSGISTSGGLLLFVTSIVGQILVVATVFVARLRTKEFMANA